MDISTQRLKLANIVSLALIQVFIIITFAVYLKGGVYMADQIFLIFQVIINIGFIVSPEDKQMLILKYRYFVVYLLALIIAVLSIVTFFVWITSAAYLPGGWTFLMILHMITIALNTGTFVFYVKRLADEKQA